MGTFVFRLQTLLDRRAEARQRAQDALLERERALEAERNTMRELEIAKASAAARYEKRRLERSRSKERCGVRILNHDSVLQGLKLDVQAAHSSILAQQIFVDQAFDLVTEARNLLETRRGEEKVLETFRDNAQARFLREQQYKEELEQDEIGNVMHLSRRERR